MVVKKVQVIVLKDNWLIKKRNLPPDTKTRMKKASDTKKKLAKKQVKV